MKPLTTGLFVNCLCVLTALASTPADGPKGNETFEHLLKATAQTHPIVRSAQNQALGAQRDLETAKWAFWPTFSVTAERSSSTGSARQPASTISIQQTLWSAGSTSARVKAAQAKAHAGEFNTSTLKTDVSLRLLEAWASYLDAQASISVNEKTLAGLSRYQSLMERRVQAGMSASVDLRLLDVRITRARTELADAKTSAEIALKRIEQISSTPLEQQSNELKRPIEVSALKTWLSQQPNLNFSSLLNELPALKKAQAEMQAASHELEALKADQWPKIVLRHQRAIGGEATPTERNLWTVGLNYTTGAGMANHSQAQAESDRLQARLQAIEALLKEKEEQISLDTSNLKREINRQPSLQDTVDSAKDVLTSYERQYFAGMKTWQEVLNALQELSQSELRLEQARNGATSAYYRLRLNKGDMTTNWMD
jgi:adhesin transport system outer membrane protein